MKKLHLLSTVAAAMLISTAALAAQGKNDVAPERAPAAQQNAPAEKVAPPMHAGERNRSETTGQASQESKSGERNRTESKSGGHDKTGMKNGRSETTGQAPKSSESSKPEMNHEGRSGANGDMKNSPPSDNGASTRENEHTKSGASERSSESMKSKGSTTGQGAAAGSAKLSSQQRTKITTIIKKQKVEPTHLNISVHVGARIPASVHYHPLPADVVAVYPEWRGFYFILVADQIIVIDPHDHEIVAILET